MLSFLISPHAAHPLPESAHQYWVHHTHILLYLIGIFIYLIIILPYLINILPYRIDVLLYFIDTLLYLVNIFLYLIDIFNYALQHFVISFTILLYYINILENISQILSVSYWRLAILCQYFTISYQYFAVSYWNFTVSFDHTVPVRVICANCEANILLQKFHNTSPPLDGDKFLDFFFCVYSKIIFWQYISWTISIFENRNWYSKRSLWHFTPYPDGKLPLFKKIMSFRDPW